MSDESDESAALRDRDEKIERLESELSDERKSSSSLRHAIQELEFKIGILEKSYSTQLDEARRTTEAAERSLAEQRERNAELDTARQDAIELLTEAKTELDRLTAECAQLRRRRGGTGASPDTPNGDAGHEDWSDEDEGTINALMNDASWLRRKGPSEEERLQAEAEKRAAEEAEADAGDMLAPELVLAPGRNGT